MKSSPIVYIQIPTKHIKKENSAISSPSKKYEWIVQGTTSMLPKIHNNNKLYLLNGKGTLCRYLPLKIFSFVCLTVMLLSCFFFPNLMTVDYGYCVIYYYYSSPKYCVTFSVIIVKPVKNTNSLMQSNQYNIKIIYLFVLKLLLWPKWCVFIN